MPKFPDLTALTAPAAADLLAILDVSDTTQSAGGTTKNIRWDNLAPATLVTNVRYVSALFTGMGAPYYTTITLALAAASSGDLIWVYPGTYAESFTLVNGVNIHCCQGVTISGNTTYTIRDNAGAVSCSILGFGVFTNATANGNALNLSGSGTIFIRCKSIGFIAAGASQLGGGATITGSGSVTIDCEQIYTDNAGTGARKALNVGGTGTTVIYRATIEQTNAQNNNNQATITVANTSGTGLTIFDALIRNYATSSNTTVFSHVSSARVRLVNCRVQNLNDATASHGITVTTTDTLVLEGCSIITTNASSESLTASEAMNVKIYSTCVANKAKNGNVTVQVGTLVVDTNVI